MLSTIKVLRPAKSRSISGLSILKVIRSENSRSILGKGKLILIISFILLGYALSFAQPGTLDPSFDPGMGADGYVRTTSIQNDGKIIIGGSFTDYDGKLRNRIARVNVDGSLDTSFDPGTGATAPFPISGIRTTSIQSDGKIIIGGDFTSYNGTARIRIARLNVDGSLDTTFDPGAGTNFSVMTISIQSDEKIIIAGDFTTYNGTAINRIARLNTDGSLDMTFNPGTGASNWIETSFLQSDGKIIIGGGFTSYNGTTRNRIARVNTDGSLDTSFDPGTGVTGITSGLVVKTTSLQSDGKIIIGGNFNSYDGTARNRIARLNADGSPDTTFNPGLGTESHVLTISIQSDGKIIIGGSFTKYNSTARRYIARLNTDGSLDTSFDPGPGANNHINTALIQNDGRIIIGGRFNSYDGTLRGGVARLFDCPVTTSSQTETACNSFVWNGNTYGSSGTYTDTMPNVAGCDSIMSLNLTINTVDTSVTDSIYFLTSNATGATYQWLDCDNNMAPVAGGTGQTFSPTTSGNYAVQIAQNGCTDTSACYNITVSGVYTNYRADNIVVYPNPAEGIFSIEYSNDKTTPYNITDIAGKLVKKGVLTGHRTVIDLSETGPGFYLLKMDGQTIKLIRQ